MLKFNPYNKSIDKLAAEAAGIYNEMAKLSRRKSDLDDIYAKAGQLGISLSRADYELNLICIERSAVDLNDRLLSVLSRLEFIKQQAKNWEDEYLLKLICRANLRNNKLNDLGFMGKRDPNYNYKKVEF